MDHKSRQGARAHNESNQRNAMKPIAAFLLALLITGAYFLVVYWFIVYVWPRLPPWATLVGFVLLAAFAIGSPLMWLLRLDRKHGTYTRSKHKRR